MSEILSLRVKCDKNHTTLLKGPPDFYIECSPCDLCGDHKFLSMNYKCSKCDKWIDVILREDKY